MKTAKNITCQRDAGSTVAMVGRDGYKQLGCPRITPINKTLLAYCGRPLKIKGQCSVEVQLAKQVKKKMPLIVVHESGSNLLGLDWSDVFGLTSGGLLALKSSESALSVIGLAEATKSVVEKNFYFAQDKICQCFSRTAGKVFVDQSVNSSTSRGDAYLIQFTTYPIGNQAKSSR